MDRREKGVRAAGAAAARTSLFFLVPAGIAAMPALVSTPWLVPLAVVDGLALAGSISWATQLGLRAMLRAAGTAALALACLVFVAGGVLPRLGIYRPVTVYSNSMRPSFDAGDMIVVMPKATSHVRIGDVITYAIPIGDRHTESHRIVKIIKRGTHPVVVTKGDANHDMDPWNAKLTTSAVWVYRARIPYLGYAVIWLRMPFVRVLCLVMLPLLLAAIAVAHIWGYRIVRLEARNHATAL
jgi:signal peptidase I